MTSPDPRNVDALLARVRAGESIEVDLHLDLFPDTRVEGSEVRQGRDGRLEHVTRFCEFASGHGWSVEQRQVAPLDEAAAREVLRYAKAR